MSQYDVNNDPHIVGGYELMREQAREQDLAVRLQYGNRAGDGRPELDETSKLSYAVLPEVGDTVIIKDMPGKTGTVTAISEMDRSVEVTIDGASMMIPVNYVSKAVKVESQIRMHTLTPLMGVGPMYDTGIMREEDDPKDDTDPDYEENPKDVDEDAHICPDCQTDMVAMDDGHGFMCPNCQKTVESKARHESKMVRSCLKVLKESQRTPFLHRLGKQLKERRDANNPSKAFVYAVESTLKSLRIPSKPFWRSFMVQSKKGMLEDPSKPDNRTQYKCQECDKIFKSSNTDDPQCPNCHSTDLEVE